jgi:hypothetical protein
LEGRKLVATHPAINLAEEAEEKSATNAVKQNNAEKRS